MFKKNDEPEGMPQSKCLCSSVDGPIDEKMKCVWCMQGEDAKLPNRSRNKLFRIGTISAWRTFKRHTVFLEDSELRDLLTWLIESTSALSDPFAKDDMYHHACWLKYTHVYAKFRTEMNKSEWVYDICGGGDYIAAALSSLGISDEQLLSNLAHRLSEKIK